MNLIKLIIMSHFLTIVLHAEIFEMPLKDEVWFKNFSTYENLKSLLINENNFLLNRNLTESRLVNTSILEIGINDKSYYVLEMPFKFISNSQENYEKLNQTGLGDLTFGLNSKYHPLKNKTIFTNIDLSYSPSFLKKELINRRGNLFTISAGLGQKFIQLSYLISLTSCWYGDQNQQLEIIENHIDWKIKSILKYSFDEIKSIKVGYQLDLYDSLSKKMVNVNIQDPSSIGKIEQAQYQKNELFISGEYLMSKELSFDAGVALNYTSARHQSWRNATATNIDQYKIEEYFSTCFNFGIQFKF